MAVNMSHPKSRIEDDDGLYLEAKAHFTPEGKTSEVDMGNMTQLEMVTEEGEKKERLSNQKGTSGLPLDIVRKKGKTNISLTFDTFRVANIAMAIMGEVSDVTYTPETLADQSFVVEELNRYFHIGYRHLDASTVVVKDKNDAAVDSSLIEVNERLGNIMIKEGGTVNKGDTIKISFATISKEGFIIRASRQASLRGKLRLECTNLVNGKEFEVEALKVDLASSGSGINWAGNDFQAAQLSGLALIGGKDAKGNKIEDPYTIFGEY